MLLLIYNVLYLYMYFKEDIKNLKKTNKNEIQNFKDIINLKDLQIESLKDTSNNKKQESNLGNMISDENYELDQIKQNMDSRVSYY